MISAFTTARFRCALLSSSSRARVAFDACARGTSTRVCTWYITKVARTLACLPADDTPVE